MCFNDFLIIGSPRPFPLFLKETIGENILVSCSSDMPHPVSVIAIITDDAVRSVDIEIDISGESDSGLSETV